MLDDRYEKLRPAPPTPSDELCSCREFPPLLLRSVLSSNPVACARCNLEVEPESLSMSSGLVDALAYWRSYHDCFYLLWLDSGEFEAWALAQLSDPRSPVNAKGLALRAVMDGVRRTYYWWFQDTGAEDFCAFRDVSSLRLEAQRNRACGPRL